MSEGTILNLDGKKQKTIAEDLLKKAQHVGVELEQEKVGFVLICVKCLHPLEPNLSCKCSTRKVVQYD